MNNINQNFWKGKRVFLSGHTGFKGTWLSIWLNSMGANVCGYALKPKTNPNLFELTGAKELLEHNIGNILNINKLKKVMLSFKPEIVIHMAAQPLVRESYKHPPKTYKTNVIGTVNLFEAVRGCNSVRVIVNVTTDKVYENKERSKPYREDEPLGGYDPYSASKACSEIATSSYRDSFFNPKDYKTHKIAVASVRAGNVIGGGDWSTDRLIPDCIRALSNNKNIYIRNPNATRPWQYVLEPLMGYLLLAEKLYKYGPQYGGAWNFGPDNKDCKSVRWVVEKFCEISGSEGCSVGLYVVIEGNHPHEAHFLKLDNSKAKKQLNWYPKLTIENALELVDEWMVSYSQGADIKALCQKQINDYLNLGG